MRTLLLTFVALTMGLPVAFAAPPAVQPDEASPVAGRLAGRWAVNPTLTQRLSGQPGGKIKTLAFEDDPAVAATVPERYAKLGRLYMAGRMTINGNIVFPFVLASVGGAPHLFFFRARNGDPMGDSESFFVTLPRGEDPKSDLLFLGGDFAREPYMAFDRTK